MKTKLDNELLNSMSKNQGNWKGIFYFNRKDPRLIVPKLYPSLGWTLNFASPYTYLLVVAIVLIILASKYLIN
jgi:uncharacterized membrane protein